MTQFAIQALRVETRRIARLPKDGHMTTPPPARIQTGQEVDKGFLEAPMLLAFVNKKNNQALTFEELIPRFDFEFRTKYARCKSDLYAVWVEGHDVARIGKELKDRTSGTFRLYRLA